MNTITDFENLSMYAKYYNLLKRGLLNEEAKELFTKYNNETLSQFKYKNFDTLLNNLNK